jgi:hypothetical protein
VAHELAHFYLADLLDRLPPVVEEGYCELIASRIHPAPASKDWRMIYASVSYLDHFTVRVEGPASRAHLAYLVQDVPPIEVALAADGDELRHADSRAQDAYYGLGWVVADAVGLDGLVELEQRREERDLEKIPVDWILRRAGLEPLTQESLAAAFAHATGAPSAGQPIMITLSDD